MRLVIQRVSKAAVHIGGVCAGAVGPGLLILAGIEEEDTEEDVSWLANKAATMRIFPTRTENESFRKGGGWKRVGGEPVYAACLHPEREQALFHPRREA